jgi:hypothetical protein
MSDSGGQPASVTDALGVLDRALDYLATADTAGLPTSVQADALLALAKAWARHTVARLLMPAASAASGRRLVVVDPSEVDDGQVRDVTRVLASVVRRCGCRVAAGHACRVVAGGAE